ncbi:HTH-type transcriptional repressor DasR (plasmid) [Roseivivax sp. THAF40]|uniref:GntR family transcriptional regulator n=1 Tax=unclassified Roseivivax TaxID=2639302 RepID=UPI001268EA58|nr:MULTISPECIES: GntR family transcriptional regulator [unclassified Roseivivax]QFS84849.1 HTH-type transcriptional repressor DasR [Roseivivax sp. THAF197b]QFT48751.1 HTH-type transcriptional repressor DasR [Roseivivax sp. THAF40]
MPDETALPRYLQVAETLIRDIAAGRLPDGARLPPERDMASEWDISVGTLRKALARLQEAGLLERVQGSGNYVRRASQDLGIYAFFRIEQIAGGGLPTAQLLSVQRRAKDPDMPDFGTSPEGHRIRRLRRIGDIPAVLEEIWLDGDVTEEIRRSELSESLYLYYRNALGVVITRAEDRIGVADVPDWVVPEATFAPGSAAGFIERISQDAGGAPVEYSRTWFDSRHVRYVSRLR